MNCAICIGHLREKKQCPGCRGDDNQKPAHCVNCGIRNCEKLKSKFCFACDLFPCSRLKRLDRRYRAKYRMSMLENLENLKKGPKKIHSAGNKAPDLPCLRRNHLRSQWQMHGLRKNPGIKTMEVTS